jgi:hypothetical protein
MELECADCRCDEVVVHYRIVGVDESESWRKRMTVEPVALTCARCGESRLIDESTIIEIVRVRT